MRSPAPNPCVNMPHHTHYSNTCLLIHVHARCRAAAGVDDDRDGGSDRGLRSRGGLALPRLLGHAGRSLATVATLVEHAGSSLATVTAPYGLLARGLSRSRLSRADARPPVRPSHQPTRTSLASTHPHLPRRRTSQSTQEPVGATNTSRPTRSCGKTRSAQVNRCAPTVPPHTWPDCCAARLAAQRSTP